MPEIRLERDFDQSVDQIFDILSDVEQHRRFMPLCRQSEVLGASRSVEGGKEVDASYLVASRKYGIRRTFQMTMRADRARHEITVSSAGAEAGLEGAGSITRLESRAGGTHLVSEIRYQPLRGALRLVPLGPVVRAAFRKIMAAVEKRAETLEAKSRNSTQAAPRLAREPAAKAAPAGRANPRQPVLDLFPKNSVGAEIGVLMGSFAAQILAAARPRRLHLIDPWMALDKGPGYGTTWYSEVDQEYMDSLHALVVTKFAAEQASGVVEIHRGFSWNVLESFEDASLDWIYVDGDHSYDAVMRDLDLSHAKVKPGGIIAGGGHSASGWWKDDVIRAVSEFADRHKLETIPVGGDQFAFRKA